LKLKNKNILLGVTGSIAAYKSAILTRLLIKEGANVKIILTPYAKEFITPVTLATLSKNTVLCDFFYHDDGKWNNHVELGTWADLMLIAPATANTIAKMAAGIADNLLLTTYLSARCPVVVAPAMDLDMFNHSATKNNITVLKTRGVTFIEPSVGELASGLSGKGRLEEPEVILEHITIFFDSKKKLENKKFLVTAGPTLESIDPVRFISNHSSGKMGYAIAEVLGNFGARVTLISGKTNLVVNNPNITLVNVTTAEEMHISSLKEYSDSDCAILTAAVCDFRPVIKSSGKLKKSDNTLTLELEQTTDIAEELGKIKNKKQLLIGFALETENEIKNAKIKLKKKNFDFIVLNSLRNAGAGFNYDTNKISIIDHRGITDFELKPKPEVAKDIVYKIIQLL
jgi:phosphopantothenoylcysteine decarboxylase / phosphopantothenate---cysteine ligase